MSAAAESPTAELDELHAYRETHQQCRKELALWLLEVEERHAAFGAMLEHLRARIVPALA